MRRAQRGYGEAVVGAVDLRVGQRGREAGEVERGGLGAVRRWGRDGALDSEEVGGRDGGAREERGVEELADVAGVGGALGRGGDGEVEGDAADGAELAGEELGSQRRAEAI